MEWRGDGSEGMDASTIEPGLPVEIGQIDKKLGKLWEASDDTKTRASLINLVIYSEASGSLVSNTKLIEEIAGQHACRAILIFANPAAAKASARAWISAHCHFTKTGGHQICSEQITFQLDGESVAAMPSIVFSHLDSDLPLCFWWQTDFPESLDENLWTWVDRLIFDSATWTDPVRQFTLIRQIESQTHARTVLCDLNWTRLQSWRFALASLFDHAAALPCLARINSVRLVCAPGFRTTGFLLLGWLASQLQWSFQTLLNKNFFVSRDGVAVQFSLSESPGAELSLIELSCEDASFRLCRDPSSEFFHACLRAPGAPEVTQTLGARRYKLTNVLLAELSRGGRHPLYGKAALMAQQLLSA